MSREIRDASFVQLVGRRRCERLQVVPKGAWDVYRANAETAMPLLPCVWLRSRRVCDWV